MLKVYNSKRFLNKDGFLADSSIFSDIRFNYEEYTSHNAKIQIRDCHDSIELNFTLDEEDDDNNYENSIHKLNTLIGELALYKVKFIEAKEEFNRRKTAEEAEIKQRENKISNS